MRKYLAFLISLCIIVLCFASCSERQDSTFSPIITVNFPYSISGNVISATFYNCGIISPFKSITFSEGKPVLYFDDKMEEYLDSEYFIPEEGIHDYCIAVQNENKTETVTYVLRLNNIIVKKLSIMPLYEKTYAVGEVFDRKSVIVFAVNDNDEEVEIKDYDVTYSFDEEGTKEVVISVGKIHAEILVTVSGTFSDVLDEKMKSQSGAKFAIRDERAVLTDGSEVTGAFTVPESVSFNGKTYPVKEIGSNAFSGNRELTAIQIKHPVTIGESAFQECDGLTNAYICNGTEIGRFAFAYCTSLTTVILPEDIYIIRDGTFTHCTSLVLSSLPSTVIRIESQAFSFCESIISMNLPQATEFIGARSFKSCYSLETMVCGAGLEYAEDGAFSDNPSLRMLIIPSKTYVKDDGVIYGDDNITVYAGTTSPLIYHCNKKGIPCVKLNENSAQILITRDRFEINDEIMDSEIGFIVNSDDYLGFAPNYGISYDFSVPGMRKVSVNYEDYSASLDVFVEYRVQLAADMDEYGNIYELDESTGKAYLAKLKDNAFGGAFILPTSVDSGEDNYEVVGVRSGAIKDCNNLEKLFLHSGVTLLEDGSISDCASLKVLYFGTPKGVAVKIGEGNFTGLNEDFVILCSNVNATVMYNYVRTNSMAYAGLERNTLYFTSTKSAQKSYEPDEEFKPEGFNIIYVDENWDCHFIDKSELVFEYDFSVNNIVTVNYEDKTATYAVSLIG